MAQLVVGTPTYTSGQAIPQLIPELGSDRGTKARPRLAGPMGSVSQQQQRQRQRQGESGGPSASAALLLALAVGAAGVALYWSSTRCGFCLDDHLAIEENADVSSELLGGPVLWHDFWGRDMNAENSHKSWRPFTIFTFQLNYLAGKLQPAGYHTVNVVLHGLVCAAVVQLAMLTSGGCMKTSLLAGLAFAAHPVHVEAVAGVVGRADELGTLFSILAFLAYIRLLRACAVLPALHTSVDIDNRRRRRVDVDGIFVWAGGFLVCAWLAMLSKEVAVTLLGIVAAYDLALQPWRASWLPLPVRRGKGPPGFSALPLVALALRWLLLAVCGGSYLFVRALLTADSGKATLEGSQLLRRAENPFAAPFTSGWGRLGSLLYLQAFYGKLLLSPSGDLCCEYSYNCIPAVDSVSDPRNLGTVMFWSGMIWLVVWCVRSHTQCWVTPDEDEAGKPEGEAAEEDEAAGGVEIRGAYALCALSWLVLPMLPATNFFFTVGTLVAERLLYMPSVGLVLLFAHAAVTLAKSRPRLAPVVWAGCVLVLAVGAQRTLERTEDWLDDEALYTSAVVVCPESAKNRHQLGQIYMNQASDIKAAALDPGGSIRARPKRSGVVEVAAEEVAVLTSKAVAQFEEVMRIDPEFCDVQHNLGQHYVAVCQEAVIAAVERANSKSRATTLGGPLRLSDCGELLVGLGYLRANVGCIFTNMKSYPLMMQVYNILLEEQPTNATLWGEIGSVYEAIGDEEAAAAHYTSQGQAFLRASSGDRSSGDRSSGDDREVSIQWKNPDFLLNF